MAGISINLSGNFQKLDELKDKAGKTAASIKSAFGSTAGKAMFAGVAAGATAAFVGITAAVSKAIDKGGELNDMMLRTGASGKGLVILQKAFENAGLAASQVPQVLNKMQKALAGVNEEGEPTNAAFAKIGLSIEELQKLDPVEAFQKTAQAIAGIESPAQRTAAAMEIFGKSGGELLAVMNDPEAFAQARDQVGSLADMLPGVAGEFDSVGDAMGSFSSKVEQLGTRVAISLLPALTAMVELMNAVDLGTFDWTDPFSSDLKPADRKAAKQKADDWAKDDPMNGKSPIEVAKAKLDAANGDFWAGKEAEKQAAIKKQADLERAAAEKKAESDRQSAEEKAKSRAAALDEYNLESAILSAKLAGNAKRLEALEREKKIREEMQRLESAGFTADEARAPATAKVDAETKIAANADAKEKAADEKKRIADILAGRLQDVQGRQKGHQFQSTIGAASSMQRIGGGGGAVSSGLDYARQAADLQRESNDLQREMVALLRPAMD
ncbi:hypothetical protein HQ447_07320 [bacterium]|nr:hypothetical protein [bacterium]